MKKRILSNPQNISSLSDNVHNTEWTCAAELAKWIDEIAKVKNIPLGNAVVETTTELSRKRADIIIYETPKNVDVICVIECKRPFWDVFDDELKDDARKKANKRKSPYFATCNFKKLIWWNTEKSNNPVITEEQQIIEKYNISEIENLDEIENLRYREPIRKELERFISKLYAVLTGKEAEPKQAIDEHLIDRLHEKIHVLSYFYRDIISDKFHKDPLFGKKLKNWFVEQMWEFTDQKSDFDKAARQTAYLLVNKILFYDVLQAKLPKELDPLKIPESLTKGSVLQKTLQMYFDEVLKIDYETVYTADFIDNIVIQDDDYELVKQIKDLVSVLNRYNFATLGYDILGRVFERLIPQNERHSLGQYFTSADVVDLILRFCSTNEDDKLFDPSCGAGTFLVRAYQHKKLMNQYKKHEEILDNLWGNDIAKFPAHLSTINLAINDLGVLKNYPNILQSDFFALQVGPDGFDNEKWRSRRAKTLGVEERDVKCPRYFDAIVGNPPYTRQEEIEGSSDKATLINNALMFGNSKIANISKQAGIHAYFFVHGWKFLKEGGYFGFIISNSWMDTEFGAGLQEFFLRSYKIVAIIESKVERWFPDADINTCIVILQKCSDEKERKQNLARFVLLKKTLRNFIPVAENEWNKQVERKDAVDNLIKTIFAHSTFYENADLRVFPISQQKLWEEGLRNFDSEDEIKKKKIPNFKKNNILGITEEPDIEYKIDKSDFPGSKWGKYLFAPKIYFEIYKKRKQNIVQLNEIATIKRGFTTGANEFFYLTEVEIKKRKIEKEYWMTKNEMGKWIPNYLIKSPRECNTIIVNPEDLKFRVLMIHEEKKKLKGKYVLQYILSGEKKGFNKLDTLAARQRSFNNWENSKWSESTKQRSASPTFYGWYDLGKWKKPDLIWADAYNTRYAVYDAQNMWADKRFFYIYLFEPKIFPLLFAYLNSTLITLLIEIDGIKNLGEGAIYTNVYQLERLEVPIPKEYDGKRISLIFEKFRKRKIESIFDELGAIYPSDVALSKVKPDRRELDKIIMGDILGLNEDEQLEVYRSVLDLVKSRIEKAKSVEKKAKFEDGIDIKMAKNDAIRGLKNKIK